MADLNLTLSKFSADRFIVALERADAAELTRVLDRKKISVLERDTLCKAHAMLHGDVGAVEVWFETVPELIGRDGLTDRERELIELADLAAETCTVCQ